MEARRRGISRGWTGVCKRRKKRGGMWRGCGRLFRRWNNVSYQRDFEKTLRVGVVGVGSHCNRNILPALHYLPVKLAALCDKNETVLAKTATETGVTATFTDPAKMYAEAGLDAVLLVVG